jgi:undecaprenyl-diphosphatase
MEILRLLEGIRTPFLDTAFGLITHLGEQMIIILIFCAVYWCINKKMGYVMGVIFFLSALFVQGLKIVFRIPRSWLEDPNFTIVESARAEATGYSFPSGHTQAATAYLGPLGAMLKPKWVKAILFALPVLVAFSRMYLGVHTLQDVVVSLLITFTIVFFAVRFFDKETESKKRDLFLSALIALCAVIVIVYAAVLYHGNIVEASQLRDSVIAAGAALGAAVGLFVERNYIRFSVKAPNIFIQVLKYVLGIAGLIGVQEGARIIGSGLIASGIRYFLMIIWLTVVFPLIIKRFFTAKDLLVSDKNETEIT